MVDGSVEESGLPVLLASIEADERTPARERMLIGMAKTVAERGYRGATITDVVAYARVSKRTFYEEFSDKEACFLELYDRTRQTLGAVVLDRADPTDEDWRGQLRRGARAYYVSLAAAPRLTYAFFLEIATLSPQAQRLHRAAFDQWGEAMMELVERGRAAHPEIRSRPLTKPMATAILGGITDVMIAALERGDMEESVDELVDTFTDLVATIVTGEFPPEG